MTTAISDMEAAYTDAASRVNPDFNEHNAGLLGGLTAGSTSARTSRATSPTWSPPRSRATPAAEIANCPWP
eukprot:16445800-Heterocapsa_arctica.AAC.1